MSKATFRQLGGKAPRLLEVMAHIGTRDGMTDISDLVAAMLKCGQGRPAAEVAQAGLDIALGLWAMSGDVTRDMAIQVVTSQIESRFTERSN